MVWLKLRGSNRGCAFFVARLRLRHFFMLGGVNVKDAFLYNPKAHTLHIKGYCRFTKGKTDYIPFATEDEALAHDGRAVGMCKLCLKEREKRMEKK